MREEKSRSIQEWYGYKEYSHYKNNGWGDIDDIDNDLFDGADEYVPHSEEDEYDYEPNKYKYLLIRR